MNTKQKLALSILWGISLFPVVAEPPLVVYTHRHYAEDEELFREFTAETGIPVQTVKAGADELLARLKAEGAQSRAEVLITADAGRLVEAAREDLLAPVTSEILTRRVPAPYRDPDGRWFGFTLRARVLVYAPDRVKPGELSTYEDLADPKWRGRLLSRSSSNIYNLSLMASFLEANGEEKSLAWAKAVRENLARPPQGSDRDQIRAVAAGLGDVALVNTYYLGLLLNSEDKNDRLPAEKVRVFFPNQQGRGTHVNISGGGVLKSSRQPDNARRLLEFLVSDSAQKRFPLATQEYPVAVDVGWSPLQKQWGEFKADELNLRVLGDRSREALKLFNLAGWE